MTLPLDFTKIIIFIVAAISTVCTIAGLKNCTLESYHEGFCLGRQISLFLFVHRFMDLID